MLGIDFRTFILHSVKQIVEVFPSGLGIVIVWPVRIYEAWRARCVLGNPEKRMKIILLCWLAAPIEGLIMLLQTLDEMGKGSR